MDQMRYIVPVFVATIAAAGCYYLFKSRLVDELGQFESPAQNHARRLVRQTGSVLLLLLAGMFFWGWIEIDTDHPSRWAPLVWLAVLVLLLAVTIVAMIDFRLTMRLRRNHKPPRP